MENRYRYQTSRIERAVLVLSIVFFAGLFLVALAKAYGAEQTSQGTIVPPEIVDHVVSGVPIGDATTSAVVCDDYSCMAAARRVAICRTTSGSVWGSYYSAASKRCVTLCDGGDIVRHPCGI
jgi:hypothetical protein